MSVPATELVVNGEIRLVPSGATVSDVVALTALVHDGVAVALNGEVVPRSAWVAVRPSRGDRIEILVAAPGG